MTRAGFAVAVIALVSTVGLATEECCTSAQAQTQPASPRSGSCDSAVRTCSFDYVWLGRMREYSAPRRSAPQLFMDVEATLAASWSAHNEMSPVVTESYP